MSLNQTFQLEATQSGWHFFPVIQFVHIIQFATASNQIFWTNYS